MEALPAGPTPAPRNQITVASSLAAAAMVMLMGGMLAVWAVQRSQAVDLGGSWVPDGTVVPEVPSNVMLIAFAPLCIFAQWAAWSAKQRDMPHAGLALGSTALMALLIINAQFFIYHEFGLGVADGPYESMFYAITGAFIAIMVIGLLFTIVVAFRALGGRTADRELLTAHAIYWYAATAVFCGIWFVIYVTK